VVDIALGEAVSQGGDNVVDLGTGLPLRIILRPVAGSFPVDEIMLASIVMRSVAGRFGEIRALTAGAITADTPGASGLPAIAVTFAKSDLRTFLESYGTPDTVTVAIEGERLGGRRVRALLQLRLIPAVPRVMRIAPNPVRSAGYLTFATSAPGPVSIRIYDAQGRVVQRLAEGAYVDQGVHDFRLDFSAGTPHAFGSGVYFCRLDGPDGVLSGRFVLLR
jgi:hypothetical protein